MEGRRGDVSARCAARPALQAKGAEQRPDDHRAENIPIVQRGPQRFRRIELRVEDRFHVGLSVAQKRRQ